LQVAALAENSLKIWKAENGLNLLRLLRLFIVEPATFNLQPATSYRRNFVQGVVFHLWRSAVGNS